MKARINEIVHEKLGLGGTPLDIRPENTMIADMGADSIDMVDLAMGLEEEYSLFIPDDDFNRWKSVGDIHRYVESVVGK